MFRSLRIAGDMRLTAEKIAAALLVTVITVAVNLLLFSFFPLLHQLFEDQVAETLGVPPPAQVVMEFKKPEKREEAPKERTVRPSDRASPRGTAGGLQFKFAPDLSVEGSGEAVMAEQELAAVIFEEGETDVAAVPLYQPPIPYPDRARDLEIEGILEVIIIIDTQGKVSSIEVVRSPHVTITEAARQVISTWRFKPALNKGVPVRIRGRQVIEFTLK